MSNRLPRITVEKREGIKKLLEFCVERYKAMKSPIGKQMYHIHKEFLAELQKKQFYDENDKRQYNEIRDLYLLNKKRDNE
jgi:hypothetical protein